MFLAVSCLSKLICTCLEVRVLAVRKLVCSALVF